MLLIALPLAFLVRSHPQADSAKAERNPHPAMAYTVTVTTNGAPGPLTPGVIHVSYAAASAGSKPCYPIDSFVGAPISRPADREASYPLQAVGDHLYRGVIDADAFQDTNAYPGYPACHWVVDGVTASVKGNGKTFSIEAAGWDSPSTVYFQKTSDAGPERQTEITGSSDRTLLFVPMPDIWTARLAFAPAAPGLPAFGQLASQRSQMPPGLLDPSTYARDPRAYEKMEAAIRAIVRPGEKIEAERFDDLRGEDSLSGDALAILGPVGDAASPPTPRRLVILTGGDAGPLTPFVQNSRIIPCSRCNDMLDEPGSILRPIESAFIRHTFPDDYLNSRLHGFQVFLEGGGRDHWWRIYTFVYSGERKDWMLFAAELGILDTETGRRDEVRLTAKDFGPIRFEDFDPAALQQPKLP